MKPARLTIPAGTVDSSALRPEQAVRLDLLRIVMVPTLMRDAGVAIKFAEQLEAYVMNGAGKPETGGQGSQPPA